MSVSYQLAIHHLYEAIVIYSTSNELRPHFFTSNLRTIHNRKHKYVLSYFILYNYDGGVHDIDMHCRMKTLLVLGHIYVRRVANKIDKDGFDLEGGMNHRSAGHW